MKFEQFGWLYYLISFNSLQIARSLEICEDALKITTDGNVEFQNGISYNGLVFTNGTYWKNGDEYFGCPCKVRKCIYLCKSADMEEETMPDKNLEVFILDVTITKSKLVDHFYPLTHLYCSKRNSIQLNSQEDHDDMYYISKNGSLHFPNKFEEMNFSPKSYCIGRNGRFVQICLETPDQKPSNWWNIVYSIFLLASSLLLFVTLVTFWLTPDLQSLHGKSIACYATTLMAAFVSLAVNRLLEPNHQSAVCKLSAYITYGFMLASFFWLNTMFFDLMWAFSDYKKMVGTLENVENKKFSLYLLYSTTMPSIFFFTLVFMDNVFDYTSPIWPGIGVEQQCWFNNKTTKFLFYLVPVLATLISNATFIALIVAKILKTRREAKALKSDEGLAKNRKYETRLMVYVKLFIFVGASCLMEMITWFFDDTSCWICIISNLFNYLQGVHIFILCVWNYKKAHDSLFTFVKNIKLPCLELNSQSTREPIQTYSEVSQQHSVDLNETPMLELDNLAGEQGNANA